MRGDRDFEYIICLHACTNVYISTAAGTHTFIHILLLSWQIDMSIRKYSVTCCGNQVIIYTHT